MNYKKELNKLRKHRKQYRPIMAMLMKMHTQSDFSDFPVELINQMFVLVQVPTLQAILLNVSHNRNENIPEGTDKTFKFRIVRVLP